MQYKPPKFSYVEISRLACRGIGGAASGFLPDDLADPILVRFLAYGNLYPLEIVADYLQIKIIHWQSHRVESSCR
jgi:hypothetical protein